MFTVVVPVLSFVIFTLMTVVGVFCVTDVTEAGQALMYINVFLY